MASSSSRDGDIAGSFQAFFEGWLVRQEQLLYELTRVIEPSGGGGGRSSRRTGDEEEDVARDVVARVLAHYEEYYAEKSRMANADVFLAFSPTWFTPLEKTLLWIAGFKPGLVCRLTMSSVDDLTEDQIRRVETLRRETNRQEKLLSETMAKIQESLASPPMVESARRQAGFPPVDGEIDEVGHQIESLKSAMVNVLRDADGLRMRTAETVFGTLSPVQNLKLLAAVAQLHFRIRTLGIQRERDNQQNQRNCEYNGHGW